MRLKPVRGSIIGKTSDGYTATASNNKISPEVEQRVGEHVCELVCMCVCGQGEVGEGDETMGDGEKRNKYSGIPAAQWEEIIKENGSIYFIIVVVSAGQMLEKIFSTMTTLLSRFGLNTFGTERSFSWVDTVGKTLSGDHNAVYRHHGLLDSGKRYKYFLDTHSSRRPVVL